MRDRFTEIALQMMANEIFGDSPMREQAVDSHVGLGPSVRAVELALSSTAKREAQDRGRGFFAQVLREAVVAGRDGLVAAVQVVRRPRLVHSDVLEEPATLAGHAGD